MATAAPFDAWAAGYDSTFTDRPPAQWLRESVHLRVAPLITPGARILEIGCGTGADALWMAQCGCDVLATDASEAMLDCTRDRLRRANPGTRVAVHNLDATDPRAFARLGEREFDGVFSNFGALNCLPDVRALFGAVDPLIGRGGWIAITLMGRFCLAETLWFCLHANFRAARRRWSGMSSFELGGERYGVWYHTPGDLRRGAGRGYSHVGTFGVGAFLPTSAGYHVCERWPRVFRALANLDRKLARTHYMISDHYLLVLRKKS